MNIRKQVSTNILKILKTDKKSVLYLLYYSSIEAILVLSIPLASSFIINSVLAHASISIFVLAAIISIIFLLAIVLQILKAYIIEKFEQKIFITSAIKVVLMAKELQDETVETKKSMEKYMNYFFDISAIQKIFPIILLDGMGLVIKIVVSLILLLAFDPLFFGLGMAFFVVFLSILFFLGRNGFGYAIKRSDAKHNSIYFLQHIPEREESKREILEKLDEHLHTFVNARKKIFRVVLNQLTLTYFMEGFILTAFLVLGGYLVINGHLPIGEFVATEIVVVSITYALKGFMKQIDYIYDMVEGVYKVEKLEVSLGEKIDDKV